MGKVLTKMFGDANGSPARILMLGLDGAGKTTILYTLQLGEQINTVPTVGFNVERVTLCKGTTFTVWDVGGQEKTRGLWNLYFKGSHGLVFVVDSADTERLPEAREEILRMCKCEELRNVPLIVIANKQDLPGALSGSEISKRLSLPQLKARYCKVYEACALRGNDLMQPMLSLATYLKEYKKKTKTKSRRRISLGS